jgi:hypothetical protein
MADAKITVSAEDLASATIEKVGESMGGLSETANTVTETAHQLRDALTEAFENPLGALQSLGSEIEHSLGPLGAVAGLATTAVVGMSAAVVELGEKGAEIADVQTGFERFAGSVENASAILSEMRDGVHGTISDFALTTDALHLMSAGVELTAGDFGTLSQASLVLAHEGFGTTKEILDELTQSMITGRTRVVERMTGVLDAKAAEDTYAAGLGVSTDQLTKEGQAEAKRQEILERLRQVVADAGDQELSFKDRIDQMKTSMTNASDAMSVAVATSPVLGEVLKTVGDSLSAAFGANQVSTIQTIVHAIDQGAIELVGFGEAGLTAADYISHAWSGMQVAVSGSLSLITEAGLLTVRAYQAAANLSAAITTGTKSTFYADEAAQAKALGDQLQAMQKSFHDDAEAALTATVSHTAFDDTISKAQAVLEDLRQKMITASQTNVDATKIMNALGEAHSNTARKIKAASTENINSFGGLITINKDVETSYQDLTLKVDNWSTTTERDIAAANASAREYLQNSRDEIQAAVDGWGNLTASVNVFHDGISVAGDTVTTVTIPMFGTLATGVLPQATQAIKDATKETASLADELSGSLTQALQSMPSLLERAFTGGGGLEGAMEALGTKFGADFGKRIEASLSDTLSSTFGDTIGDAIGAAIPAVGALIGPLIGKLFSIGGPSAAEEAGRKLEASFEQGFGGFTGMMDTVGKAYAQAGLSAQQAQADVTSLMNAEKQGSAATQAAIDVINANMAKGTANVSSGVQSILDAAKIVGSEFPAALQPVIASLLQSDQLTDDEKTSLEGLANAGNPTFSDLSAAAGRYGLSLDSVGGKVAQLSISTQADQIESDYDTLVTKGGADSDKVLAGMKTSLNDLVNHALDAGDVLPTAIQPLVDQLLKTGQLTDDAGNSITDLSNLKFDDTGDPLATGMSSLTDAINNLSKILGELPNDAQTAADGMGKALNGVKVNPVIVPVDYQTNGGPDVSTAAMGGDVTPHGVVYAALGFPGEPSGSDTVPAWLTPGERVLSVPDNQRFEQQGGLSVLRNGDAASSAALEAIHATIKRQGEQMTALLKQQPAMLRHALRGA